MRIERVTVGADAVEALVRFEPGEALRTCEAPGFAGRMLHALPGLRGHRCDNGGGMTFPQELEDTEFAHALEHAALEVMALAGSPATLRGVTSWDFRRDGRGVFNVRLDYDDSAVAVGSLTCACEIVRACASGVEAPDAAVEAGRLRRLRAGERSDGREGLDRVAPARPGE